MIIYVHLTEYLKLELRDIAVHTCTKQVNTAREAIEEPTR